MYPILRRRLDFKVTLVVRLSLLILCNDVERVLFVRGWEKRRRRSDHDLYLIAFLLLKGSEPPFLPIIILDPSSLVWLLRLLDCWLGDDRLLFRFDLLWQLR